MGVTVSPDAQVEYDGRILKAEKKVYVLLNKPKDTVTTTDDPEGRRTVMDIVAGACKERIYPVGRLDRSTTGILLLTNDGEMAEKLMHLRCSRRMGSLTGRPQNRSGVRFFPKVIRWILQCFTGTSAGMNRIHRH